MHRINCECGQSFASHSLDGRPREVCPLCRRAVPPEQDQALAAAIDETSPEAYPYAPEPPPPSVVLPPLGKASRQPFVMSAGAIASVGAVGATGFLAHFTLLWAFLMSGRLPAIEAALGWASFVMLLAVPATFGSIVSVLVRWRFDGRTVAGWLLGPVTGLFVIAGLGGLFAGIVRPGIFPTAGIQVMGLLLFIVRLIAHVIVAGAAAT